MMISRREALFALSAAVPGKSFPLAICSETFPGMSFADLCTTARRIGYTGLEIDTSNLGADPSRLAPAQRASFRRIMEDADLRFVGFHSFLKAPTGLHLTTADKSVREKSWEFFARLIEVCAHLGPKPLMVLGSGKQRTGNGVEPLIAGLARMAPIAEQQGVTILLEPLSPQFTDTVNTIGEAEAVVRKIGSPALRTMLDTHNLVAEKDPHPSLVSKHLELIRHVHLNEMDGRFPGSGSYPFAPLLQALRKHRYSGWLSVEVFDFRPDGETVARKAFEYIRQIERKLS
jgi:D-psicose/D-tagatose/L-ribulose 3-epimerase